LTLSIIFDIFKGLKEIKTIAVEFNIIYNNALRVEKILILKDIESYYNIEAENGILKTKGFSFYHDLNIPEVLGHSTRIVIEKGGKIEKNVKTVLPKFSHLGKKRVRINKILNSKEFFSEIFNEFKDNEIDEITDQFGNIISKALQNSNLCNECINCSSILFFKKKSKLSSAKNEEINNELKEHLHVIISGKTLANKKIELLDHYKFAHNF